MDEERVEYSYVGDVTSLRQATRTAISLLNQYESAVKRLASSDQFNVGKTAFAGFQRTVNGIVKQVGALSSYMSTASIGDQNTLAPDAANAVSAYQNIADVLNMMQSGTKLTTEDFKLMNLVLQDTKNALDPLVSRARAMSTSFNQVAQITEQSMRQMDSAVDTTTQDVSANVTTLGQQWDSYVNRMSKSAEMSAQVFERAGRFTAFQTGVDNAVNRIILMRSRVDEAIGSMTTKVRSLATVFDPVTTRLESYKSKASGALNAVRKALDSIASAFRRSAQATDSSEHEADQSAQAHSRLANSVQTLQSSMQSEQSALKQEEKALRSKNQALRNSSRNHSGLANVINQLGLMLSSETTNIGSFTNSLHLATAGTNLLRRALSRLTLLRIGQWLAQSVKSSIAYTENVNLFAVAMGDAVEEGRRFVESMSEIYGMDPSNLYRYVGYFYQLTDAIGMAADSSSTLSLSLTKAANDIASLFNVDIETVIEDLAAGMQGMSRSVRKYGMDIRATTLQQTALKYGLTEQVETMSEANRMALRYLTMMEQVKNATQQTAEAVDGSATTMGDFARTIESPANQLRIFKEQITQLGRAIGNFFIPMLRAVLPALNGFVMALRTVLTFIAALTGFTEDWADSAGGLDDSADAIDSIGSSAGAAAKQLNKLLAPFDELTVLTSKQSAGGSSGLGSDILDPALQEAIENMELSLDDVKMRANEIRDTILSFLGFEWTEVFNPDTGEWETELQWFADSFKQNLIDKFPQWSNTITALFEHWTELMHGLKAVWEALLTVVDRVFDRIKSFLDLLGGDVAFAQGIENAATGLDGLATWITENSGLLADTILIVAGLSAAFKGLSTLVTVLMPVINTLSSLGSSLASVAGAIAAVLAVLAAVALLYTNSESFADSFKGLFSDLGTVLQPMLDSVVSLFSTIWESIQRLWAEHIQPLIQQTGDALAPVLDTLGELWGNLSVAFVDIANLLNRTWTTVVEPVLGAVFDALGGLMQIFQALWETVIGPILELIGDSFEDLWTQSLSPVVEDAIQIIGALMEIIAALWNNCLQPLAMLLIDVFGPVFADVFRAVWMIVEGAVDVIVAAIELLTGVLVGIVEFVAGAFTGDWKRALNGIANIFVGLGNGIIAILESVINLGISAVNGFVLLIVSAVRGIVNGMGSLISSIAKAAGYNINLQVNWSPTPLKGISLGRIPEVALAGGGVVTKPTEALIGEGKYDEAVIPLGDSPQMKELVDRVANARSNQSEYDQVPVQLYMDGDLFYEAMAKRARAARLRTGLSTF